MKLVQIAVAALITTLASAQAQMTVETAPSSGSNIHGPSRSPLVLLLNGLGVYVESPYVGVSLLAQALQQQGFRTRVDSHLMGRTGGIVPDIIIGHSMGGETALRYARQLTRAGYQAPLVITIDAAPAPRPAPSGGASTLPAPVFPA